MNKFNENNVTIFYYNTICYVNIICLDLIIKCVKYAIMEIILHYKVSNKLCTQLTNICYIKHKTYNAQIPIL